MAARPERRSAERVVLDDVDRELALALQEDGRASYAKLADLVGMSQAGVRTRVQRLLASGAVHVAAIADPFAFGFNITALLGVTSRGDLNRLATKLGDLEAVHFVVLTAGRYDCVAEVVCVDNDDLFTLVNDQVRAIEGVLEVDVITYLRLHKQWQPEFLAPRR
jgi:Lrp/AsnC family transcriptional regulator for asnA, asnC and gidA